jgi:hypothetical protein
LLMSISIFKFFQKNIQIFPVFLTAVIASQLKVLKSLASTPITNIL